MASPAAASGWEDARQQVLLYAEICASAAIALAVRGPHGAHAAAIVRQATDALRDISAQIRPLAFDEAVIEAERNRAAEEALAAAGVVPPTARRKLRAVTGPMRRL